MMDLTGRGRVKRPYLHPNRFVTLDLPHNRRLHVWHPDVPQAQKIYTPIHDHIFSFSSIVLTGMLTHTVYEKTKNKNGMYQLYSAVDKLFPTGEYCDFETKQILNLSQGSFYTFEAFKFHQSYGEGLTATIMTVKTKAYGVTAKVAVPRLLAPDNEFERDQYPAETLQPFIDMVWHMVPKEFK